MTSSNTTDSAVIRPRRHLPMAWLAVFAVAIVCLLIVVAWLLVTLQVSAIVMAIPALVPLAIVVSIIVWLDRWEPEPRILMALALFYGAGASILGTLVTGNFMLTVAARYLRTVGEVNTYAVVVQAPVIEELIKGVGILVILALARREFNGPVDGFIYGALIGAGFAFTENIVYFASAGDTGVSLVWVLVVRCILAPFAHVLFSGLIGIGVGWATRRTGIGRIVLGFLAGLLAAILTHAFWNGGSVLVLPMLGINPNNPVGWIAFYVLTQVPLFAACTWLVLRLIDDDRAATRHRLREYTEAGWFTASELRMLTDLDNRAKALAWARKRGARAHRAMTGFIRDATRLAYAREHASIDKKDPDRRIAERALLDEVLARRRELQEATE
ncbi:protease PrsW [Pseudoclavibacter endophyticus]|uniref:PrsW family intramembrane metalloprotease n=1 Tax=Pseudoclavibacter endophyticus TaxID=1778590 RepID=A0A6H9WLB4_9MICO|nr:PrsW family intramembrane metalloprotease [Pseudoclavibacter endophyticus]KAB1649923.1 PrsW family intramembrane metalloprotease [Pseudoclavibacter endophyticus]GGA58696.1 protease PrsW [Pseudoclavibacter endophyticus]